MAIAASVCAVLAAVGFYALSDSETGVVEKTHVSTIEDKQTNESKSSGLDSVQIMINERGSVYLDKAIKIPVLKVEEGGRIVAQTARARLGLGSRSQVEVVSSWCAQDSLVIRTFKNWPRSVAKIA